LGGCHSRQGARRRSIRRIRAETKSFAKKPSRRSPIRRLLPVAVALLLPCSSAAADSFPVTTTAGSGEGSLFAAIQAANAHLGPDSIPIEAAGTIELSGALPEITDEVGISGPGQDALTVRREAVSDFRIFEAGMVSVSLAGMTIANGRAPEGGGILAGGALTLTEVRVSGNEAAASGGLEAAASGGGVLSFGPLTMRRATVSGNTATASEATNLNEARGGGVAAFGGALIERSTVSGNTARADGAGLGEFAVGEGGGLLLNGEKLNRIQASTISGNTAAASGASSAASAFGGGAEGTNVIVTGSTIAGNSGGAGGGANLDVAQESLLRDTIVSDPGGGPNCGQPLISEGFNIEDGTSCGFAEPTDHSGVDPGIDPNLGANGGPTLTHALLPGSVAIDAGSAFGAATDQRGLPRPGDFVAVPNPPGGDGSDIGAFELQAPAPLPAAAPAPDTGPPRTRIDHTPPDRTRRPVARFWFSSSEPGSRFECRLDGRPFRACEAPWTVRVKRGAKHVFRVRAIDQAGNVDSSPARYAWLVMRLPGHHARAQ
jgi:hypothetical protein